MGGFAGVVCLTLLPIVAAAQPAATTTPPLRTATSGDIAAGKHVFDAQCAWCHGVNGTGGTGPLLQRPTLRTRPTTNPSSTSCATASLERRCRRSPSRSPSRRRGRPLLRSVARPCRHATVARRRATRCRVRTSGCSSCHIVAGKAACSTGADRHRGAPRPDTPARLADQSRGHAPAGLSRGASRHAERHGSPRHQTR